MKQVIFLALTFLMIGGLFAQTQTRVKAPSLMETEPARLVKTYLNYTATSDDTTGWITIDDATFGNIPLALPEVYLVAVAGDSVNADVYIIGRNSVLTSALNGTADTVGTPISPYVDSLHTKSNSNSASVYGVITLKSSTVNRLPGCNQFRIGTVFRATGQGTTAARTLKWYVMWNKP